MRLGSVELLSHIKNVIIKVITIINIIIIIINYYHYYFFIYYYCYFYYYNYYFIREVTKEQHVEIKYFTGAG